MFTPLRISEKAWKPKSLYLYIHGGIQNKFGFVQKDTAICAGDYINLKNLVQVNGMQILRTSVLMECSLRWSILCVEYLSRLGCNAMTAGICRY